MNGATPRGDEWSGRAEGGRFIHNRATFAGGAGGAEGDPVALTSAAGMRSPAVHRWGRRYGGQVETSPG